jgi:hypothetical protein
MSRGSRSGPGCCGCLFLVCVLVAGSMFLLFNLGVPRRFAAVSPGPSGSPRPPSARRRPPRLWPPRPQPPPPPQPQPPTPQPEPQPPRSQPPRAFEPVPEALNEFGRVSRGDDEQLTWGFVDYERSIHRVTCDVDRRGHERELRRFGYVPEQVQSEVARRLLPLIEAALEARGYGGKVSMSWEGDELRWRVAPLPDMERAMADIRAIVDEVWASHELRIRAEIYADKGFLIDAEHNLQVAYADLARRASPLLKDCYLSLARSGEGYDLGQYLGLFVAFLQEIPYELPPAEVDGRRTLGFWVPTEVLVGNHGDCDSKSAAFCALWRQLGTPVLIVELPDHVLVGVAVPPRAGQQFVRLGSRTFVLCEVAGPGKLRPGASTRVSGHFRYTLVEPTREGLAVTRGGS